ATRTQGFEDGCPVSAPLAHLLTGRSEGTRYSLRSGTGKAARPRRATRRRCSRIRAGDRSRCGHDRTYKRVQISPNSSELETVNKRKVLNDLCTLMQTTTNCC